MTRLVSQTPPRNDHLRKVFFSALMTLCAPTRYQPDFASTSHPRQCLSAADLQLIITERVCAVCLRYVAHPTEVCNCFAGSGSRLDHDQEAIVVNSQLHRTTCSKSNKSELDYF